MLVLRLVLPGVKATCFCLSADQRHLGYKESMEFLE
jgi:hypothetical protein